MIEFSLQRWSLQLLSIAAAAALCSAPAAAMASVTSSGACLSNQFQCETSGICIRNSYQCNGINNCDDLSDERNCTERKCLSNQFQCETSGICIRNSYQCNGINNCDDLSDERNCKERKCLSNQFQCESDGICIRREYVCNGINNCDDLSDERNCKERKCLSNQFQCETSGICIRESYVCNGKADCDDLSDERNCTENISLCPENFLLMSDVCWAYMDVNVTWRDADVLCRSHEGYLATILTVVELTHIQYYLTNDVWSGVRFPMWVGLSHGVEMEPSPGLGSTPTSEPRCGFLASNSTVVVSHTDDCNRTMSALCQAQPLASFL